MVYENMKNPQWIYVDGQLVPYADARLHVSTVAVKYGANVFEGLCAYERDDGRLLLFRAAEHFQRLQDSVRMMQVECKYSFADYERAVVDALVANEVAGDAHIRLSIFVLGEGGSDTCGPTSLVCVVNPRPTTQLEQRVKRAATTTWLRLDDRMAPPRLKAGANYHNSRFGLLEAKKNGYDEAIFLTLSGKVSEGASSCLFMVRKGRLVTPPITSAILESITRETIIDIAARSLDISVDVRDVDRSELYLADEIFLCGSGYEVTPVVSVDQFDVCERQVGPITRAIWECYESVVRGRRPDYARWTTEVSKSRVGETSRVGDGV